MSPKPSAEAHENGSRLAAQAVRKSLDFQELSREFSRLEGNTWVIEDTFYIAERWFNFIVMEAHKKVRNECGAWPHYNSPFFSTSFAHLFAFSAAKSDYDR